MPRIGTILAVVLCAGLAAAQSSKPVQVWNMQNSGTTAGLRGIHSVDGTVAWASGTGGTVLRTLDGGVHWTRCATPDAGKDGATLDFRGIQAWDAQTAIVMASGLGDKSRLYKTTDGCRTWNLLYTDPDNGGFWDSFRFFDRQNGLLLGDPTLSTGDFVLESGDNTDATHIQKGSKSRPQFTLLFTADGGDHWRRQYYSFAPTPIEVENVSNSAAFAASNTAVAINGHHAWFGTGGASGASVYIGELYGPAPPGIICNCFPMPPNTTWITHHVRVPIAGGNDSSGIFSLDFRDLEHGVTVGGDYTKPNDSARTAAWSVDGGEHWTASITPPHGYRSAVQYSESLKAWITVGTNGSDISRDDGRTWTPLDTGTWNALSLPFVVGPDGRIARLNPQVAGSSTR